MLSKKENAVMNAVYSQCNEKVSALVCPVDLLNIVGGKQFTLSELEKTLLDLSQDGYFDMVYSDRRGETIYCISLTPKGRAYSRERHVFKRNLVYRLVLSAVFAVISFLIGLFLKAVF